MRKLPVNNDNFKEALEKLELLGYSFRIAPSKGVKWILINDLQKTITFEYGDDVYDDYTIIEVEDLQLNTPSTESTHCKIIINFTVEDNRLKNSVVFENNPTVYNAIQSLDSALQMFKKAVLTKADANGVSDENFNLFTKEVTVNELNED